MSPRLSPKTRIVFKFIFGLGIWSFLVLGFFKLNGDSVAQHQFQQAPINGRLLLNKDNRWTGNEATSTTTDRYASPMGAGVDEVLVDNRAVIDDEQLVRDVENRIPSLPIAYWSKHKNVVQKKGGCAKYPSIFELEFNNIYWQTLRTSNGTFQLYGAYYDIRKQSRLGPAVRILGMIDRIEPKVKTFCQLWFDGQKEPFIVKTFEYKYIWFNKWGNYKQGIYQPYLIACQIPKPFRGLVPASVSIVENHCDTATNNLRVLYNRPVDDKKKGFAVCVKGLDFLYDDLSVRLVEWIEMLGILGADKIFFYELQVHPNISKVLRYYEEQDRVHVTPLTLPGGQPNVPGFQHLFLSKKTTHKRQNELIPYNDCLYKNMYRYEYIALLDIDEVIMPKLEEDRTWRDLMNRVVEKSFKVRNDSHHSFNVRNVYFFDQDQHDHEWAKDVPRYMHMVQHVHRSKNYTKPNQYVKCFHNPERVLTLHNHFPISCLGGACHSFPISTDDAQLQHYRADCVRTLKKSCEEFRENQIRDTTIWKYKDELIQRTRRTLDILGFFRPSSSIGGRGKDSLFKR
ncbi:uncharacterized protein LOC129758338 [Uranotaenia lowii]|uniref:uncharacterized protein LOC129758338 n=1 Tax=Uranotaenia lowii TaxID=190385 RepID=UPI00247A0374|nr:uncharacterized protein LOC129758338 [Uranotaenia lowii]XP_055611813.1 uncharacterized protein LOC129758338 [Uranotaenia lowii]XP_055611814.1 uncharacterized protein LOC129758338 [Uranotaenia lowii]XP_055611815.1 uncharacterized protein LOC129758338 [Uranotaenia lowii]XP_055611816.1 uncharacterized protein LOC129758338 [Uranotaenia lowii]XP_055611817.1 uncharacterized protein LOC129758338 [Uranotaenia lowii]XP_055611818.1 uncharacterized protein LOC129758338 [Uranotaenia lowii]